MAKKVKNKTHKGLKKVSKKRQMVLKSQVLVETIKVVKNQLRLQEDMLNLVL